MFQTKRAGIAAWLKTAVPSSFAALLSDWHSGQMRAKFLNLGLTKPEFHIDWRDDYKCINIQGRYQGLYVDIQIEPDAFFIAADADEPDEPETFPLESRDGFYEVVRTALGSSLSFRTP